MRETNLLELLNGTLVDTTALVDEVTGLSSCQRAPSRASHVCAGEMMMMLTVVDLPESTCLDATCQYSRVVATALEVGRTR